MAVDIDAGRAQRVQAGMLGIGQASGQIILAELIHQEADRAEIHAVDLRPGPHRCVQGFEHHAIAAERDDDVGLGNRDMAIALFKASLGGLGVWAWAGEKGERW